MKSGKLESGAFFDLHCTHVARPEFPELLFGTHEDGGVYFDATSYLQQKSPNLSLDGFFKHFDFPIQAIAEEYQIPGSKIVITNLEGHKLISSCLCYLFLSYVNPSFNAYLFERIDEMFGSGVTVSDSYLAETTKRRLPSDLIPDIWKTK